MASVDPASVWYVDTSALAKLVRPEGETAALRRWLGGRRWVVSDLHRTELRRAAARAGGRAPARADRLLGELDVVRVTVEVFEAAGRLGPAPLRSLDALHLSAARQLGSDLAGLVTYDRRMADSCARLGLHVVSPGLASGTV